MMKPAARKCSLGHTIAGDNAVSVGKAGVRCRECRQRISRESEARRVRPSSQVATPALDAAVDRFAEALAETGDVTAACFRLKLPVTLGARYLATIRRGLGPQAS